MNYDVAIIGSGTMGMAAGYYLSKHHKRVVLMDANDPPHTEGSHHGGTRLIRHAYGEGEDYVPMVLRAQELWLNLEKEANQTLFHQTGVLNISRESSDFLQNVLKSATTHSLRLEKMTAHDMNTRWKGFEIPNDLMGCYEPESGVLMSEACVQAYRDLAAQQGATFFTHSPINDIRTGHGEITIETTQQTIKASELIISAGKGTNDILAMLGLQLPLQPTRKTFSWFDSDETLYQKGRFPAWTYDVDDDTYYGFPSIDGAGVKIGRHSGGHPVNSTDSLDAFGTYPEDMGDVARLSHAIMPEELPHKEGKVCTYTNTPDGDFIIDRFENHPNIKVACGFSGHGFKFASVIGEILSELVLNGASKQDLSRFKLNRF